MSRGQRKTYNLPDHRTAGGDREQESSWLWIQRYAHTLDTVGGVKPFPSWGFLQRLVDVFDQHRLVLVAKSRQMMVTWAVLATVLYRSLHHPPGIYLLLSKGGRDTGELVKRLKILVRHLPDEVKEGVRIKTEEVIVKSGSRIIALPAAEYAPRMHSPAGVFWDEMAFTPHDEEIWAGVKPAIDAGGWFIGVSTPNGSDNIFYRLFHDPDNGFVKERVHYSEHPLRDQRWLSEARRSLSEMRWRQEYEVDFLAMSERVFDEFDPSLHLLPQPFTYTSEKGRTVRGVDFGYRHPYVLWGQLSAEGDLTIFAEWEGKDATIEELGKAILNVQSQWGIKEEEIAISGCDPAGSSVGNEGLSPVERLHKMGIKMQWRRSEVMAGIDLVKFLLKDAKGRVRLRFAPSAHRTVEHLLNYRWAEGKEEPRKDEGHDHAMDALRYLVVNLWPSSSPPWSAPLVAGWKRV